MCQRSLHRQQVSDMLAAAQAADPQNVKFAGAELAPGLNEFSGSYTEFEVPSSALSGADYWRAEREAQLARAGSDVLTRSVNSKWDEPFMSIITPQKPEAISLAGYDVFGAQSLHTSNRHAILDLRGEAAIIPDFIEEIPEGASIDSLSLLDPRPGAVRVARMPASEPSEACGYGPRPATLIRLPGTCQRVNDFLLSGATQDAYGAQACPGRMSTCAAPLRNALGCDQSAQRKATEPARILSNGWQTIRGSPISQVFA